LRTSGADRDAFAAAKDVSRVSQTLRISVLTNVMDARGHPKSASLTSGAPLGFSRTDETS
jgi:hypothetical protein